MAQNQEANVHIRISPELKEHLQKQAASVGLTLSSWIKLKLAEVSGFEKQESKNR